MLKQCIKFILYFKAKKTNKILQKAVMNGSRYYGEDMHCDICGEQYLIHKLYGVTLTRGALYWLWKCNRCHGKNRITYEELF